MSEVMAGRVKFGAPGRGTTPLLTIASNRSVKARTDPANESHHLPTQKCKLVRRSIKTRDTHRPRMRVDSRVVPHTDWSERLALVRSR